MTREHYGTGWKAKRKRILDRDGWRCGWCDTDLRAKGTVATVDHVVSIEAGTARGWTRAELDDDDNLVASCRPCNSSKGKRSRPTRLDPNRSSSRGAILGAIVTTVGVECRSLSPVVQNQTRSASWTMTPASSA